MPGKIKSLDDLKKIREQNQPGTQLRVDGENPNATVLAVGMATCGIASGARTTMQTLLDEIEKNSVKNVVVMATGCIGLCWAEPLVEVREPGKDPIRYGHVDADRAREIIQKHIMNGELVNNAIVGREVPRA